MAGWDDQKYTMKKSELPNLKWQFALFMSEKYLFLAASLQKVEFLSSIRSWYRNERVPHIWKRQAASFYDQVFWPCKRQKSSYADFAHNPDNRWISKYRISVNNKTSGGKSNTLMASGKAVNDQNSLFSRVYVYHRIQRWDSWKSSLMKITASIDWFFNILLGNWAWY